MDPVAGWIMSMALSNLRNVPKQWVTHLRIWDASYWDPDTDPNTEEPETSHRDRLCMAYRVAIHNRGVLTYQHEGYWKSDFIFVTPKPTHVKSRYIEWQSEGMIMLQERSRRPIGNERGRGEFAPPKGVPCAIV